MLPKYMLFSKSQCDFYDFYKTLQSAKSEVAQGINYLDAFFS